MANFLAGDYPQVGLSQVPLPSPRLAPPDPDPPRVRVAATPSLWETPWTGILIVLNIAVFLIEIAIWFLDGGTADHIGDLVWGMPSIALLATGGNYWSATIHEMRIETLLTCCFVHGGLLHIGFNMVALRQIGPFVERTVGAARMVPLYLIGGFVSSFASTFYNFGIRQQESISVGASGAICALIGAALVIGGRVEGKSSPIMWAMVRWLGMTVFIGFALRGVDNAAHIGGAIGGAVIALLWRRGLRYSDLRRNLVLGASTLITLAAIGVVIARDVRDPLALMMADDRREAARTLLFQHHDCKGALEMARGAKRLLPKDPETLVTAQTIEENCR